MTAAAATRQHPPEGTTRPLAAAEAAPTATFRMVRLDVDTTRVVMTVGIAGTDNDRTADITLPYTDFPDVGGAVLQLVGVLMGAGARLMGMVQDSALAARTAAVQARGILGGITEVLAQVTDPDVRAAIQAKIDEAAAQIATIG